MPKKNSKVGSVMTKFLGLLLLFYSATRSIDFIKITLPEERQILAFFALAALDIGLIIWVVTYNHYSHGEWQRAIAVGMIVIDALGAIIMFTMDTLYNTGKAGLTSAMTPIQIQTTVLILSIVIALNIAAVIGHDLLSLENLKRQKEEAAFAMIEEAGLEKIAENAEKIANKLAEDIAAAWVEKAKAQYARLNDARLNDSQKAKYSLPPAIETAIERAGNNSRPK